MLAMLESISSWHCDLFPSWVKGQQEYLIKYGVNLASLEAPTLRAAAAISHLHSAVDLASCSFLGRFKRDVPYTKRSSLWLFSPRQTLLGRSNLYYVRHVYSINIIYIYIYVLLKILMDVVAFEFDRSTNKFKIMIVSIQRIRIRDLT